MYWKILFRKRIILSFAAILALLVLINVLVSNKHSSNTNVYWWKSPAPCSHPADIEKDMYMLLEKLHTLFTGQNVTHFICYGTLWGAIRYSKLLPFDRDVDLCVIYDYELSSLQQHELMRLVKEKYPELYILYDADQNIHNVYLNKAMGEIVFFRLDGSNVVRALPKFGGVDMTDSFPARLIADLQEMNIGALKLPAPDSSVMKYWYPDSYTLEKKPPNCF